MKNKNPFDKLFTRVAALGAMAVGIELFLLMLRAHGLAYALAVSHLARPLWSGTAFGQHYDLSTCGISGVVLAVAQVFGPSVYLTKWRRSAWSRCLKALFGVGWLLATVVDLCLSVFCAQAASERLIGFAVTALFAIFETALGLLALDGFVIPALLALGWAIRRWMRRRPH